ncbi:MAG: hypothetical protein GC205_03115 [Bacteroidetes bacterium]|nr:hypothetical protein [Bacteroidota bacterium]
MHLEEVKPLSWFGAGINAQKHSPALLLISLTLLVSGCRTAQLGEDWPSQKLTVCAGPEDLVLDTFRTEPRLLVSCDARRTEEPQQAGIWSLDLTSSHTVELPRFGEPEPFVFHPHGLDLVRQPLPDGVQGAAPAAQPAEAAPGEEPLRPNLNEAVPLLYVISHDDANNVHSVLVYRVFDDRLQYLRSWTDPLLNSPNAVAVLDDGTLLVTNDSGKRGNRFEALFKRKKSTVVAWNAFKNRWWVVADQLAYANGIETRGSEVYVATTRQSRVFSYRWDGESLLDRRELAKVPGADNLRWDGNDLLVAGHPSILAFVRHAGSAQKKSPIEVWRVATGLHEGPGPSGTAAPTNPTNPTNPATPGAQPTPSTRQPAPQLIFANDGHTISGAATALIWAGHLYLSQVFDPFVLKVALP